MMVESLMLMGSEGSFKLLRKQGLSCFHLASLVIWPRKLADEMLTDPSKHFVRYPWLEKEVAQLADLSANRANIEMKVLEILKKLGG